MAHCQIKKLVKQTMDKIPEQYDMTINELCQLVEIGEKSLYDAINHAYRFGFCKGTRAREKKRCPVL